MKKILALLLALTLILTLAACSGSSSGTDGASSGEAEKTAELSKSIKDDSSVPGMSFTPPEGYTFAERTFDRTSDGTLTEKNLKFYYDNDTTVNFAYGSANGKQLSELITLDGLETYDADGVTFYFYEEGSSLMALSQINDILYGIEYARAEGSEDRELLDKALESVKFEDVDSVMENADEDVMGDISYQLDPTLTIASTYSDDKQNLEGETVRKSKTWRFGKDKDNLDFRFLIRYIKGGKVEDELPSGGNFGEETVGEFTYTVRLDDDSNAYEYYLQRGDDVYVLKNLGASNGWSTTRSDESKTAFKALVESVSFS